MATASYQKAKCKHLDAFDVQDIVLDDALDVFDRRDLCFFCISFDAPKLVDCCPKPVLGFRRGYHQSDTMRVPLWLSCSRPNESA